VQCVHHWLTVHKYVGLCLGAVFVVVGLTGSILAFWQAIDESLNKELLMVAVPNQPGRYEVFVDPYIAKANLYGQRCAAAKA
jgi:uncharacterized iron-regulated membrane protein